eukprot:COSAG01_NODE_375_length_17945_cov_175.968284_15_plen_68_part_00
MQGGPHVLPLAYGLPEPPRHYCGALALAAVDQRGARAGCGGSRAPHMYITPPGSDWAGSSLTPSKIN